MSVRPAGVLGRAYKWARRKPAVAGLYAAAAVGAVLVAVTAGFAALWRDATAAHARADSARLGEEESRKAAETDRDDLRAAREKLAAVEYGRTVQVAYQECLSGNVSGAMTLLEGTRLDLRGWEWRYVHKLCNGQSLTLTGHTGQVTCVAWSPDGTKVISGGMDKTARIWDARTGGELLLLKGHTDHVYSATFSPDGAKVLTTSLNLGPSATGNPLEGTARVWEAATGKQIAVLKGHTSQHVTASFSPDGTRVLTTLTGGGARIWDATTGEQIRALHFKPGEEVPGPPWPEVDRPARGRPLFEGNGTEMGRWTPDGKRVVLLLDGRVTLWDVTSGEAVREFGTESDSSPEYSFSTLTISPDGTKLATELRARSGNAVLVWEVATGKLLTRVEGALGGLGTNSASPQTTPFNRDGTNLVSCFPDGTAKVWNATTGKELFTLKGRSQRSSTASYSPDGTRIVVTGTDGQVATVWDAATGVELAPLFGHTKSIACASISPDGTKVATGSSDGTARVWVPPTRPESPQQGADAVADWARDGRRFLSRVGGASVITDPNTQRSVVLEDSGTVRGRYFSPDGKLVLGSRVPRSNRENTSPREQPVTVVWDAASGKKVCTVAGRDVQWSPNHHGTRFVTVFDDGTARIWDTTGREVAVLRGHTRRILQVWWSPDGSRVLTSVGRGSPVPRQSGPVAEEPIRAWEAATGQQISTLDLPEPLGSHAELAWDPGGTLIATRDRSTTRVWDARTGREMWAANTPGESRWVTWSPDSAHVVSSDRGTICVRNAATSEVVRTLVGHTGGPWSASFNPDGSRLVTTAGDNTARVWDVRTGAEVLSLKCSRFSMEPATWSPDGSWFVTRDRRGSFGGGGGGPAGGPRAPEVWDATPTDPRFRDPDRPKKGP